MIEEKFTFEPTKTIDKINNIAVYIEDSREIINNCRYRFNGLFPLKRTRTRGCSLNIEYWKNRPNRTDLLIHAIRDIRNYINYYCQWMDKIIVLCEEIKIELEQEEYNVNQN